MANADLDKRHWHDDDRFYSSGSHSDDSPILSYRYEKRRYMPYTTPSPPEERERRSALSVLGRFCLFCAAMILFCVLMYIPLYKQANYDIPKGAVEGWSIHTNRDTKIYVQPNNVTTVHEPTHLCNKKTDKKLPLLVIVCSATENFERRKAIRETWANYKNYPVVLKNINEVQNRYKNYTYKYDLYPQGSEKVIVNVTANLSDVNEIVKPRIRRDISSFKQLLPVLAKALTNISITNSKTEEVPEKRFEDENDNDGVILPEFDMNKELENNNIEDYDYDYQSNVMKIPAKGYEYEENVPDLSKVLDMLKQSKYFDKIKETMSETDNTDKEYQLVFLLGMPAKNGSDVQKKIEEEIQKYGDIIQEGFVDSYNNLTLKSIMMLKWVTNKCNESVRYIFKADDDTFANLPLLLTNLKKRAKEFDSKKGPEKEYLLIGDIIAGAKPVLDSRSKWFTPRYMYKGRLYPRYLSGHGYVMSMPTAHALYHAALETHYFHLEDIYITGICAARASPRIFPRDEPSFSYMNMSNRPWGTCAQASATLHRLGPDAMRQAQNILLNPKEVDRCERIRLTRIRLARIQQKLKKLQSNTAKPKS